MKTSGSYSCYELGGVVLTRRGVGERSGADIESADRELARYGAALITVHIAKRDRWGATSSRFKQLYDHLPQIFLLFLRFFRRQRSIGRSSGLRHEETCRVLFR